MNFSSSHNNFNLNINTYSGKNNKNNANVFTNTTYHDIPMIDFTQYNDDINYNGDALFASVNAYALAGVTSTANNGVLSLLVESTLDFFDGTIDFLNNIKNSGDDLLYDLVVNKWDDVLGGFWKTCTDPLDVILRTGASIVNVGVSIIEGLFSFVEAVGDTALMVIGLVPTYFTAIYDVGVGIFTGDWSFSATGALWSKYIMPAVAYSWHEELMFDKLYENEIMSTINDYAYDAAKRDGVLYSIGEGVGYYTGMIIATTVTCGIAGGASASVGATQLTVKTVAQAGFGAIGSMGKNSSKNWDKAVAEAEEAGREVNGFDVLKSVGNAYGKAIIDGGTYFAAGAFGDYVNAGKIGGFFKSHKAGSTIAIKATKSYVSELYGTVWDFAAGKGWDYNWKDAHIDAASTVIAELGAAKVGDLFSKSGILSQGGKAWGTQNYSSDTAFKDGMKALSEADPAVRDMAVELLNENCFANSASLGEIIKVTANTGFTKGVEKSVKEISSLGFESFMNGGN